jgi:hypothetical protein
MKHMIENLKSLGMINLKVSFEDEGVSLEYFQYHSMVSSLYGLPMAIKVGGCEAKTDIDIAVGHGANKIVAPMIETHFAAQKFINHVRKFEEPFKRYLLIESITGINNVENILSDIDGLDGIVVGRSDLCGSLGLTKSDVDNDEVIVNVERAFIAAKQRGLNTIMGGSISLKSTKPIKYLMSKKLLDCFETRKAVFRVGEKSNILEIIDKALEFETHFIDGYTKKMQRRIDENNNRVSSLKLRRLK